MVICIPGSAVGYGSGNSIPLSTTVLSVVPTDVTNERPSGDTAIPSSSVAPKVTCCGVPAVNFEQVLNSDLISDLVVRVFEYSI